MDLHSNASMENAMQLAEAGQLERARDAFQQVLQECPNAAVHEMLAQVLLELDQPQDAIQAAERAVALKPQWAEAHITLAHAQRNAGLLPESLTSYHLAKTCMGEGSGSWQELVSEMQEVAHLYSQQVAKQVGLPLDISTAPGSGLGPGCVVWDCGLLLARYLAQHTPAGVLQQQSILELGSGTGLVGLAAAALGAQVMLTDEQEVMPLLEHNIQQNCKLVQAAGGSAQCAPLLWHQLQLHSPTQQSQPDWPVLAQQVEPHTQGTETVMQFLRQGLQLGGCCWLLGSDLVHAEKQVPQLRQALSWVLQQVTAASKQGSQHASGSATSTSLVRFVLAHKHRSPTVDLQLLQMLQQLGFVFVKGGLSSWGLQQSCSACTSDHACDHPTSLLFPAPQQQQQAGEWPQFRLAEYQNCGLYCLAFDPERSAQGA